MNTPRVSVIVPTYNRARLVCATLESVFAQSYQDFEIIVVDDGSTDDTAAAVAAYGDRVRYLRQANRGVNPARNCGIAAARGEFIALADSDDLWEPWKLATQVKLLETYPAVGFVFSDFFILKGDASAPNGIASWHGVSREWREIYDEYQQYSSLTLEVGPGGDFAVYRGDIYERSLYEPMVLPSTALMRRAALQATGLAFPEITETCGDWEFFARLSKARGALYMDVETAIHASVWAAAWR
jgi:glycosyltransferase involved in cell wall biosynthesis